MLSSRVNPDNNNNNNEGESTMPGDYEAWPRAAARIAPPSTASPARPMVPPRPRPGRRPPPPVPSNTAPTRRTSPVKPTTSPARRRRPRRRSLTPEIVIERRHGHRHSSGRHRVIRIPLDNRPTLGLRGPPKRVLELERVRCRRRKHRSCYEMDHADHPPPLQPQPNIIFANPISNPGFPPGQSLLVAPTVNPAASSGFFSNLTPEMIENLPKQTIHLPPIHMPGSQADANTELHTVLFPAEIINPVDGTLSIIQSNSRANGGGISHIQPSMSIPVQPQSFNIPSNNVTPLTFLSAASPPFLQQLQDLVQQITLSQAQSTLPSFNQPTIQPPFPAVAQPNTGIISRPNPQIIPQNNATAIGSYPTNIRPTNTPNSGSYNPTFSTSSNPGNIRPYRPANITPYRQPNTTTFQPTGITPSRPGNITPYRPANITPYRPPASTAPSNASDIGPYRPANITSYRQPNNSTFQPASTVPSNTSDVGPYRPANITPYGSAPNSNRSSMFPSSIPSGSTPYNSSSSLGSSGSLGYSADLGDSSIDISNPPQSQSQTPYRPNQPAPKSILRNGTSNSPLNTTYTRLHPTRVPSPSGFGRKTATFV